MATKFSSAYAEVVAGLASNHFSDDKEWKKIVLDSRKLCGAEGFDLAHEGTLRAMRKKLKAAVAGGTNEAVSLFAAAGVGTDAAVLVDADTAKRLGALKSLRHTYLLRKTGGHKVWCLSLPIAFTNWPHEALKGSQTSVKALLVAQKTRFNAEQRKDLSNASQEGLRWVHLAMIVAGAPTKESNKEKIARWFGQADTTDEQIATIAATLNAGLKKIVTILKSGQLIYTDSVSERGTDENANTEAFVWGDSLDVVYIEEEFFGKRNSLTGLKNWARIVVHELTHRELNTQDHAYEHENINPAVLTSAKAIENADSWAWFCADCGGALTKPLITNALSR